MGAIYKKAAEGIVSLVKLPTGKYIRTEKQRLAQSLRAQEREKLTDTFKYEGKTYPKSEGVKAFYKSEKNKSGTAYKWVPKHIRGRGFGNPAIRESEFAIKQTKEKKLIKSKMQELDVEELKGMYAPDLVKYIKDTLDIVRTPSALQKTQQEVIGGGWKIGSGRRGSAGPDHFTYRGKVYPKSEGVVTTYPGIGTAGATIKKWSPKAVKGMAGKNTGFLDPVISAERESIKSAFEKMDKETLKKMSGKELLAAINKIPGINRNSIPYDLREQVIGGGWKPKRGKALVEGKLAGMSGINSLSPENFTKVGEFLSMITKAYPKTDASSLIKPITDRMIKFAKRKGVPEEQIMKKLYETDIEGMGDIIIKNYELKKLWKESKDLGLKPELIDLSHIDAVERNWMKALDPSNLVFANEKSNRYLQKAIEEQIQILRKYIPQAKSLADKKMMAQQKIVLDPTKRKEHMYKYYKPRTLKEMNEELAEANLVSEIGGTRRGAKIDPNDPYFADQISKDLREQIFSEQWSQAGGMNEGGLVKGYAGGGFIKKLLDESIGAMSRRKFLKGVGAVAAQTALPRGALKLAPSIAKKAAFDFAPPWISQMATALGSAVKHKKPVKLPNGTVIEYLKKPHTEYDSHKLAVKTVDGSEDLVNYKARKNGDEVEIEFDIRDDYHNNQHIFLDKKNKKAELIDENYYMTSPEDYAKDDPIIWDVSKPSIKSDISKKALDRSIILDKTTKADDYIYDYMSMPEGSDYNYMWERYVDSFSPAGNIFKTKEYAKKIKKEEAHQKKLREERAMDNWEEQFRGGHGTHGYYRGGMSMDDYKPQVDESRRMIKLRNMSDVEALARMMHAESSSGGGGNLRDAQAIGHVIQNRSKYTGPDSTYGLKGYENYSPIKRVLAGQGQFTPFRSEKNLNFWDFDMTEEHPYYKYAAGILSGNKEDFTGGSTMFDLDPNKYAQGYNEFWNFNPSQFEHEGPHSFWGLTPRMNKGGIARRPNAVPPTSGPDSGFVTEGIDLIKANPQRFVAGGLVKKYAPKVLGKKSIYKPLITERKLDLGPDLSRVRTDLYTPPKGPYTITNESGARVLDRDFKTLKEAQDSLKEMVKGFKTQDATTFRIFGARPPKTAAGVSESAPEVNLGMVGKPLPKEKPAAMFWGSREKIIGAPSEAMTGKQWLQYLQIPKHGILNPKGLPVIKHAELNDTGLAPYLSKNKDSILSKEKLVKDFDSKLAPEIEVIPLGRMGDDGDNFYGKISNMDMQAYREGPLKNVLTGIRNIAHPLREALSNNNKEAILKIINGIDNLTFENFGVTNAIKEGFPQKFPFELKKVLQSIAQASGVRTTGFKQYARDTKYKGQQTLGGGENYREFVFKYKHPTGSIRETEPVFPYSSHDFGLSSSKRENAFVHSRVSDRTDEFGRRVLHIEEIQSDMHQRINAAARKVRKAKLAGEKPSAGDIKKSKYSPRGDLIKEPTDLANEQQMQLVLSKIEDLAALPQTKQTQIRINRLNKERIKIRKIIADKKAKMSEGEHSGVPMGPLSKSEDYNEFVMKYLTKVAQEGGYDGVTISSGAIKNRGEEIGSIDWKGNLVAYGPIAEGAMKKVAKKSGAKYLKTSIIDNKGRGWSVPMIWLDNAGVKLNIQKGLPIYKKGGMVVNG